MILTTTSEVIRIRRGAAPTTSDMTAYAAWADTTSSAFTPGQSDVDTNAGGNITLVSSPAGSTYRVITEITIFNADTVTDTMTVDFYDGTNSRKLVIVSLPSLYSLHWQKETGWYVTDGTGHRLYAMDGKVATQAEEEAGTSTAVYTTPGRQHYHPSAAKCWGEVSVSGGTPTLNVNYNITSITDTNTGDLLVTIANDFSSANYTIVTGGERTSSTGTATLARDISIKTGTRAAGSFSLECWDKTATTNAAKDPASWHFACFGDQ